MVSQPDPWSPSGAESATTQLRRAQLQDWSSHHSSPGGLDDPDAGPMAFLQYIRTSKERLASLSATLAKSSSGPEQE